MSALSNGGNYDVCNCASCANEKQPTEIRYDAEKNIIYLIKWDSKTKTLDIQPNPKENIAHTARIGRFFEE
jgi:hypothetical protein